MDVTTEQNSGKAVFQRSAQADPLFNKQEQLKKQESINQKTTQEKIIEVAEIAEPVKKTEEPKETKSDPVKEDVKPETEVKSVDTDIKEGFEPLEMSFDNKAVEPINSDATKETEIAVTETMVKEFLKSKGIEFDKLEDLSKKESLSESVQKFKEFEEQTGRSIQDYLNTQKDWAKENPANTLREFLKYDQPNYSDEDVAEQIKLWTVSEDDQDELSQKELSEKKLESKRQYNKALDFMQKKSKEFATPLVNNAQPQTEEDIAKAYEPYWNKRDKSLQSFNEVTMKLGGQEISIAVTQEDKALIARKTQSQESTFEPYILDNAKEGDVRINTDSLISNEAWSIPQIRNRFISELAKQVQSISIEQFSKQNRNVTLGGNKKADSNPLSKAGLTVVSKNGGQERRIGKPIF